MESAYLGDHTAVARTKFGSKVFLDTRDRQVAPHILLDGDWESWMTSVIIPYLKNSVFFDVGANYGWYTLVAHHARARKIVALEPNTHVFGLLKQTVQLNGVVADCHRLGAADLDGEKLQLAVNWWCPGSASFLPVEGNTLGCESIKLDTLWQDLLLSDPTLDRLSVVLKIDVEGFEPRVVAGARTLLSRRHAAVTAFVEHHKDPKGLFGFKEMLDFFESEGFILTLVEHDESLRRISRSDLEGVPDAEMLCFKRISG